MLNSLSIDPKNLKNVLLLLFAVEMIKVRKPDSQNGKCWVCNLWKCSAEALNFTFLEILRLRVHKKGAFVFF